MHTHDSKFRYMITIIIISQNDPFYHQAEIQSGEACVLTKEDMFSIFSNLAIMVLDVNFTNPYKTAGVLFFDDNDLPPFPSTFFPCKLAPWYTR